MTIHERSIRDLSIFATPPPELLMIALRAYGDESGKATGGGEKVISLGAVIAQSSQWGEFEARWKAMLDKWEIPALHMNELSKLSNKNLKTSEDDPYSKFTDVVKLQGLLEDAAEVVQKYSQASRSIAVFVEDLQKIMDQQDIKADPLSFTLYAAISMLGTWALNHRSEDPSFELVLDRLEKGHARAAEAQQLYETDQFMSWRGWPVVTPLSPKGDVGSQKLPGLQAADFVAWSVRFQLDNVKRWMMDVKPTLQPLDFPLWNKSLREYTAARTQEQHSTFPAGPVYTRVFSKLVLSGNLKYYFYDQERLEADILENRSISPPEGLMSDAIKKAGRKHPLSL